MDASSETLAVLWSTGRLPVHLQGRPGGGEQEVRGARSRRSGLLPCSLQIQFAVLGVRPGIKGERREKNARCGSRAPPSGPHLPFLGDRAPPRIFLSNSRQPCAPNRYPRKDNMLAGLQSHRRTAPCRGVESIGRGRVGRSGSYHDRRRVSCGLGLHRRSLVEIGVLRPWLGRREAPG